MVLGCGRPEPGEASGGHRPCSNTYSGVSDGEGVDRGETRRWVRWCWGGGGWRECTMHRGEKEVGRGGGEGRGACTR